MSVAQGGQFHHLRTVSHLKKNVGGVEMPIVDGLTPQKVCGESRISTLGWSDTSKSAR